MPPDDNCDLLFDAENYKDGFTNMDPDRERRCPFGVKIIENMRSARKSFGT